MITLPPKIALAAVGLGTVGGLGGWGVYEVAGGGHHYEMGKKYCLKDQSHICFILGSDGQGYRSDGLWIDPGDAQNVLAIQDETYLNYQDTKTQTNRLLTQYPGIENFIRQKIREYKARNCKYGQKMIQGKSDYYHEMTCDR
ncbi:hypothetical protein MHLP_00480 [Candidatus Mycoplasma haematolamae str. Purdue]|uniref:Uncharacterized protein n=1 Tax=Mycoplasma haematolamae (strain Purdue) TaxID=1212765 RepID=I7CEK9_MYCHA|nr:hypothetical protein [Candidatus Mycoplasma haematolamae]AFO51676.1 hypothetical protein MHLP_00480 [Candidatus Mycoplasma haematolamae str. Purdue]